MASAYDQVASNIRRFGDNDNVHAQEKIPLQPDIQQLIRCATLAASSHNTQPWKFLVSTPNNKEDNKTNLDHTVIQIIPDLSRRCPVVDPDDSHLYKSLGCAAENMVHAAAAQGFQAQVHWDEQRDRVVVDLHRDTTTNTDELYHAIFRRQCTKMAYDGSQLSQEEMEALHKVVVGEKSNVRIILLTSDDDKQRVIDYVNQGNLDQLTDPSWREELLSWIRFNPRQALDTGDGLAGRTGGSPSIPSWLGRFMAGWIITPSGQVKADTTNITSAAGVAVFVSSDSKSSWVQVGQVYERFALQATASNIRTAFINQPIEVHTIRPSFESWLGLQDGEHAQLMVRFGHGPVAPYSLRRPLEDVIVNAE
mmetsp:Transcript_4255/g.8714  ORF Transcript_4255/g.8714 Transcript_4255/m.8714 type:complete len:365 (-) Transcript_4255:356-1450(-)